MPARLNGKPKDASVTVQLKMPTSLRQKIRELAAAEGDGDVSHWIRRMAHERWESLKTEGRVG